MADPDISVVPSLDPDQGTIDIPDTVNPYLSVWWTTQTVTGVPENIMGWLVAQGWEITAVATDSTTTPATYTYALTKEGLQPKDVLLSLCNSYTVAINDAKWANEFRYNQVLENWTEMISSSQSHFEEQTNQHNADMGVYLTDLSTHMDEIEALLKETREGLALDYTGHKTTAEEFLTGLGTTEVARINEQFAASLSVQLQKLIDDGLYTSAVAADITARNVRDRDEQLQKHYDALAREKLANEHQLYEQNTQLANFKSQIIAATLNTAVTRLQGWKNVAAENQRLLAYQLDERNKLLIGLYSFVERRNDIAPEWKDMASMIAGLGDSAGGWVTP